MNGFFTFLIIIGIANAIIKWARKQAADSKSNQDAAPDKPWQRMLGDMAKTMEATMTGKQPEGSVPAAANYKTLRSPIKNGSSMDTSIAGGTFSAGMAFQRPATIVDSINAQPAEGTSLPQEPLPQWHGSLAGTEGSVAFTANLKNESVSEPMQDSFPALNFQINRNSLLQAVVMQEILTRPQDRRRRWRPH